MESRGKKILRMLQKMEAINPSADEGGRDSEETEAKKYINLEPVQLQTTESEDSALQTTSTLTNFLADSDDSLKDPDFLQSDSEESVESESDDISRAINNTSINKNITTAASTSVIASTSITASCSENSHENYTKKGELRKRKRYNITKQERKEEHTQKQRDKHYIRPGCVLCHRKCKTFFNENQRASINKQYWSMNWQERRIFVSSNVTVHDVKRRRGSVESSRKRTFKYFLKSNGKMHEVCKTFFLCTLGYNPKNDKIITNVLAREGPENIVPSFDRRGKHLKTQRIDRELIQKHVESFNPSVSHYRREHAPLKRYLPSDITIRSMHKDFITAHPNIKCSYELYRKFVSKDLNISFASLGHEECEMCESFKLHNPEHSEQSLSDDCSDCNFWKEHIKKSKEGREKYRADAEFDFPTSTVCVSADLEKVIMLPRIDMFKKVVFCQRIIVFNESFVAVGKKQKIKPFACLWHECISGRKKEDLISAFHAFMIHLRDVENIIIWLDNCAGQNKNWSLFSYLIYIINSNEIAAQTITFRYFEPGHTFMSADSFHHQVEQSLQRMKKVYDFADFVSCVQSANSGKVEIKEMKLEDFFVWPDNSSIYKINHTTPRPYLKDMVEVVAERGSFNLFYKTSFLSNEPRELNFLKLKVTKGGFKEPASISIPRGIAEERKQAILQNLVKLIPENRRQFWQNLPINDAAVDLRSDFDDI